MATVHGRKPTPRVLVDLTDDELAKGIEAMFETVHRLARPDELNRLRQAEWDVLVTDRDTLAKSSGSSREKWRVKSHLFVLLLGWGPNGLLDDVPSSLAPTQSLPEAGEVTPETIQRALPYVTVKAVSTVAQELQVPWLCEPGLQELVEQTLLPLLKECERKSGLGFEVPALSHRAQRPDHFYAFLETTEPVALAGRFQRAREEAAECWVLPEGVGQPLEWLRMAVRHWQFLAPQRFEHLPGWERARPWLTAEEQRLDDELAAHDQKRREVLEQLEAEGVDLEQRRTDARKGADAGARRLLTAKGEELVEAVSDALTELSFDVVDVDAQRAPGDKLHDLEVTDPDEAAWTALVEVKGYGRNARVNDLLQFGRYQKRFHDEHGRWPDACWYVVNQHAGQDPGGRPSVLHANPDELSTFAEDGGLAMDTVALFALLRSVELDEVHRVEARQQLRAASGAFDWRSSDQA